MANLPAQSAPSGRALRALIVDATAVGRQLGSYLLRHRGHTVETAASPADAISLALAVRFDLALVDFNFGPSIVETLAASLRQHSILRLFALVDPGTEPNDAFDATITKPLDPKALDDALTRWFEPAVHLPQLLDQLGGNTKLLPSMAQLLEKNAREWMEKLAAAIDAHDPESVRRVAHQAKGALAHFAARKAVAVARTLEEAGKEANLSNARGDLARLGDEIRQIQSDLTEIISSPR